MKGTIILLLVAALAGAVLPLQAGLNAKVGKAVADPVYSALISFVVGSFGLFIYCLVVKTEFAAISNVKSLHWSVWTAGLLGAFYVACVIILVPKIGAALTFGLVVTGQLGVSLLFDHFGLLGITIHPINWQRILGISLIIGGVLIIRKF